MDAPEVRQNIKLGAFVAGGVLLFLITIFFIGSQNNIFNKTFVISAVFKNIEGLKEGDNVWLSGVKIGTVRNVRIIKEGKVLVSLTLKDKQNEFIRKDATAYIGSDGLVGNKIVVIRTGNSPDIIQDNDTINSFSPPDTQELIAIAKDVGENARSITIDLKSIASKISKGQGIVGELLNEGPLATDFRQAVHAIKATGENTAKASSELTSLVYAMKNGDGLLPTLISDTSYAATFKSALVNVKKVSQNSASVAANLEKLTAQINNKNNAIGVLLADTAFAHKLQNTLGNAESASAKLDDNMEAMQHNFLLRGFFKKKKKAAAAAVK